MNNLLIDKLPQSVNIGGFEVRINSDFRASITFEEILKNPKLSDEQMFNKALSIYYGEDKEIKQVINSNIEEAIKKMIWFYRCGKEAKEDTESKAKQVDIYSFEHDAEKIYSAFLDQYRIDLQEIEHLHWWKFKALFGALKEDNEISKIMSIRATDISKLPKEQKEHYKKLKKIYEIPRDDEEVKANDDLTNALLSGNAEELAKALAPK